MTRGKRFADPRRTITQSDVAIPFAGIAELGEPTVFKVSTTIAAGWPLFVPVALEGGCWLFWRWLVCWYWCPIVILRDFSALPLEQRFDGGLAVPQDAAQFSPPPISGTEDFSKGNGSAREFRTDGPAQELVLVEDADLGHVPRVKPQRHRFPDAGRQRG
jgi:hypothetical protein